MKKNFFLTTYLLFTLIIGSPNKSFCYLTPKEILVVANMNARRSVSLATYYMRKRKIPKDNLIKIWCRDSENISRQDYNKKIKIPIQNYLKKKNKKNIRCLLLMYGVPLKINNIPPTLDQKTQLKELKLKIEFLKKQISLEKEKDKKKSMQKELRSKLNKLSQLNIKLDTSASVDSELSLVKLKHYSLSFWIPNPYFLFNQKKKLKYQKKDVLLVARLDGPDENIVKRIINDTIFSEKNGLKGNAYFDARWKEPKDKKKLNGYGYYDYSIHLAAKEVKRSKLLRVVLEDTKRLFKKDECPNAALYIGWYSMGHYIDAFKWIKGSIGYHIASIECSTLKNRKSNLWCIKMLQKGVSATIGPVGEPYVQSFPLPHIFVGTLLDGYWSLAECYYLSLPYISWKMVLIGDPMYRPFAKKTR